MAIMQGDVHIFINIPSILAFSLASTCLATTRGNLSLKGPGSHEISGAVHVEQHS